MKTAAKTVTKKKPAEKKVVSSNPFFQRTYEVLQNSIRESKKMTRKEAREWVDRITAISM